MADFEPGTSVVVKATPTLLGIGEVTPTPSFSNSRFTWAKFKGGTEAAFEPGELEALDIWLGSESQARAQLARQIDPPNEFQFHVLSECIDQSTCPIHPLLTGKVMTVNELAALDWPDDRPDTVHFAGSTDCGPDCCEAR